MLAVGDGLSDSVDTMHRNGETQVDYQKHLGESQGVLLEQGTNMIEAGQAIAAVGASGSWTG